jgi:hypothetical protein
MTFDPFTPIPATDYFAGQEPASGETAIPRMNLGSSAVLVSQTLQLTMFTATKSEVCNNLALTTGTTAAGATPTYAAMGIYSADVNANLTLLGQCASDTSMFAVTFTQYQRALLAPVGKTIGQRYAFAVLVVSAAAMPNFFGYNGTIVMANIPPRLNGAVPSQSVLPASVAGGSISGTSQMHCGWVSP